MNPISFFTRTRRAGRIDITDILSWVWLIGGTFVVLLPVLWAGLSSLKLSRRDHPVSADAASPGRRRTDRARLRQAAQPLAGYRRRPAA